jgi:hypothetical protein
MHEIVSLSFQSGPYTPSAGSGKRVERSWTGEACGGANGYYQNMILPKRRYFKTEPIVPGRDDMSYIWKEIRRF